jgi:hypothetical protein
MAQWDRQGPTLIAVADENEARGRTFSPKRDLKIFTLREDAVELS